jgi:hypothetical protein
LRIRGLVCVAPLAVLMHEVVRRELGATRLARVVVEGRLRGLPVAAPSPLWCRLLPGDIENAAEAHRSVTARNIHDSVGGRPWGLWLDVFHV